MDTAIQKKEIQSLRNKWTNSLEAYENDTDYISGKLSVSAQIPPEFTLRCNNYRDASPLMIKITALPKIQLFFQFTADYPAKGMPTYQISCLWLTFDQLRSLCRQLNRLWQTYSGSPILDIWGTFLQEAIAFLEMGNLLDLTEDADENSPQKKKMKFSGKNKGYGKHRVLVAKLDIPLSDYLIKFNNNIRVREFMAAWHTCSKCSQVNLGARSVVFKMCRHILCLACVKRLVSSQRPMMNAFYICPVPLCEKSVSKTKVLSFLDDIRANRAYVTKQVYSLAEKLKNTKTHEEEERPKKVVECPSCGGSVDVFSLDDNLAMCSCCGNIFCYLCDKTYHGINPCHIALEDKVRVFLAYSSASDDEKAALIYKYGQKRLSRLVLQMCPPVEPAKVAVEPIEVDE
ncbi:unnamed protein product [Nezara viridula]|uniref:RWD domain-containing protein n=1 Tax=Nezara viridula TaxID=85310 RepID=A0A9P0EBX8_NEZVI|nr:unnamed protein product [Nezara viridula]